MHLVAPLDKHFSLLYVLLKEHIADDVDYKVIVIYKPHHGLSSLESCCEDVSHWAHKHIIENL
jgi:hypothetical protein